jgi:hypothetical protein
MVGLDHANNFEDALQTSPVGVLPRSTAETVKVYTRHKRTWSKARPAGLGSVRKIESLMQVLRSL